MMLTGELNRLLRKAALRRVVAEGIGTAVLLAVVVGSGIMGVQLAEGNLAVALLANALTTAFGLYVLISIFAPISGAQFNPVVSLALWWRGEQSALRTGAYLGAQVLGAVAGVWLAHAMFDQVLLQQSTHTRSGFGQWLSEVVATMGLLLTIFLGRKTTPNQVAVLVASYIAAAYWFTASTSFANPAVTLARAFTDSFAGIAPRDVFGFVSAQLIGLILAMALQKLFDSADNHVSSSC